MAGEIFDAEKKLFQEHYEGSYGYNGTIDAIREQEFNRIKDIYLDHVGATLYSKRQIEAHVVDLQQSVFGNPHSGNTSSQKSADLIDEARNIVARHFNTTLEKHHVIFTSGATAALKLVAENFDWTEASNFIFTEDSHTSAVGIREVARKSGSNVICMTEQEVHAKFQETALRATEDSSNTENVGDKISIDTSKASNRKHDGFIDESKGVSDKPERFCDELGISNDKSKEIIVDLMRLEMESKQGDREPKPVKDESKLINGESKHINENVLPVADKGCNHRSSNLFCFPAMSNFCGRKYPLDWVSLSKQGLLSHRSENNAKWFVLLDAASYVGTNKLDLSQVTADFVPISFYKMFGFPTGIGALVMRADATDSFRSKCYFGGGTVYSTISKINHRVFRNEIAQRYEDGTNSFLSIIALKHGFFSLKLCTATMLSITNHTFALTQYTYNVMRTMMHCNGIKLCKIYSDAEYQDSKAQGPVINFNLINSNGDYIGYSQVEKLANLSKIHLRTGCFCNTGDCQKHLGLSTDQMLDNYNAGHVCGDQMDVINGVPTGSVRISFGYMSTFEDAWSFLEFLKDCFLVPSEHSSTDENFMKIMDSSKERFVIRQEVVTHESPSDVYPHEKRDFINGLHKNRCVSSQIESQQGESSSQENIIEEKRKNHQLYQDTDVKRKLSRNELNQKIEQISANSVDPFVDEKEKIISHSSNSDFSSRENGRCYLKRIYLYPVKSCGAFKVSKWMVSEKGLLYDREWMVVTEYGSVLTQKKEPRMVFIKPSIDMKNRVLTLQSNGHNDVSVPLDFDFCKDVQALSRDNCLSRVCGDRVSCNDCGDEVATWLSNVLKKSCRLVRQNAEQKRMLKKKKNVNVSTELRPEEHRLSLTNESQFLLISEASLSELFKSFKSSKECFNLDDLAASFRGNFLINGSIPYEEDAWREIQIGSFCLMASGRCQRCQMICINQNTAMRNREPLETLVRMRGSRMEFGIYLVSKHSKEELCSVQIGDEVVAVL